MMYSNVTRTLTNNFGLITREILHNNAPKDRHAFVMQLEPVKQRVMQLSSMKS